MTVHWLVESERTGSTLVLHARCGATSPGRSSERTPRELTVWWSSVTCEACLAHAT